MKILFWTEQYLPAIGGVEVFGAALMRALGRRGHEFSVVTCKGKNDLSDREVIEGVNVYRFPFHQRLLSRDLRSIRAVCDEIVDLKKQVAPDVVHMNTTMPSIFFQVHSEGLDDLPSVVTIHSPPLFVGATPTLFSRLVREARKVTTVSDAMRQALLEAVPDVSDRTTTVYNGLEVPDLEPTALPFDPIRIMCAGRLVEEKGFDVALKAFRLLLDVRPGAVMTIAGDGPARAELEGLTLELGLKKSVRFTGWIDPAEIPALMNTATVVVMPSRWEEPFGLVALQASQVARPVIATRVGGLPEVVLDGETGFVVDADDADLIFAKMMELTRDPVLSEKLGCRGRDRALKEFTMERCADDYENIYRSVLN